jgi:gluconokinase
MKKHIIIMGVTGCGKSTIGHMLADELGAAFYDGDDYHSQENIDKMMGGIPLTDSDRKPWLESITAMIRDSSSNSVTACSALKKSYRDILRTAGNVTFIYLDGSKEIILSRLEQRTHNAEHFMPASLLDSQLKTLEDPAGEADVYTVSINDSTKNIISTILTLTKSR